MAASPQSASLLGRRGRLELDELLATLVVDGYLLAEDAKLVRMGARSGRSTVELHPLVLVANAKLPNQRDPGRPLGLEVLTEWLAGHASLPYLKIDPMKINAAAVTQVVSHAYAQRHRILPVGCRAGRGHLRDLRTVRHALGQGSRPDDSAGHAARGRPTRSTSTATCWSSTASSARSSSPRTPRAPATTVPRDPQFRAVGGAGQGWRNRRGRPPRRAYRRLAAAIRVRAARIGHSPGAAPRR